MEQNKKGIELIRSINTEWLKALEEEDIELRYLMYQPFTDDYWNQKYKIVWCNLEPGGEPEDKDEKILKLNTYKKWLDRKNPTIKNTSLYIYCLYNKLNGNDINEEKINVIKNDSELLINYVSKVTYMNILKDCGTSRFNNEWFNKFYSGEKGLKDRERTKDIINALEPDIFIITGEGKYLIQELYSKQFDEEHSFVRNKTLFINLGHPTRLAYKTILDNVNLIFNNLNRYKLYKE